MNESILMTFFNQNGFEDISYHVYTFRTKSSVADWTIELHYGMKKPIYYWCLIKLKKNFGWYVPSPDWPV